MAFRRNPAYRSNEGNTAPLFNGERHASEKRRPRPWETELHIIEVYEVA